MSRSGDLRLEKTYNNEKCMLEMKLGVDLEGHIAACLDDFVDADEESLD